MGGSVVLFGRKRATLSLDSPFRLAFGFLVRWFHRTVLDSDERMHTGRSFPFAIDFIHSCESEAVAKVKLRPVELSLQHKPELSNIRRSGVRHLSNTGQSIPKLL